MQKFADQSKNFGSRLRFIRRSWLLNCSWKILVCYVLSLLPACAVCSFFSVAISGRILLWAVLCWGLFFLLILLRKKPDLKHYAACYDLVNGNNSRLQNGYELSCRKNGDSFVCWALEDALRSVTAEGVRRTYYRFSVREFLLVQLAVVLLSCPVVHELPALSRKEGRASSGESLAGPEKAEHRASAKSRLKNVSDDAALRSEKFQSSFSGAGKSGSAAAGRVSNAGPCGDFSRSSGTDKAAVQPRAEQAGKQESRFQTAAKSSADSGFSQESDDLHLNTESGQLAAEDYAMQEADERRKMHDRTQKTPPMPPVSLSLNDRALPAGRDVASDSGKDSDQDPTESPRGDASGAKNHREIAATLPVLPLVDSIDGMFDDGQELRQSMQGPQRPSSVSDRPGKIAEPSAEPALSGRVLPRIFRKFNSLRNHYE